MPYFILRVGSWCCGCQLSYPVKTQLKPPKGQYWEMPVVGGFGWLELFLCRQLLHHHQVPVPVPSSKQKRKELRVDGGGGELLEWSLDQIRELLFLAWNWQLKSDEWRLSPSGWGKERRNTENQFEQQKTTSEGYQMSSSIKGKYFFFMKCFFIIFLFLDVFLLLNLQFHLQLPKIISSCLNCTALKEQKESRIKASNVKEKCFLH